MAAVYFVPAFIGFVVILQGGLNRQIGLRWGLSAATFLNSLVFAVAAGVLYAVARYYPESIPAPYRNRGDLSVFSWWYLVPGMCGFLLVVGIPWVIGRMGAFKCFLILVTAQLVGSLLWDAFVEGIPPTTTRLAGALLAAMGALLTTWTPSRS